MTSLQRVNEQKTLSSHRGGARRVVPCSATQQRRLRTPLDQIRNVIDRSWNDGAEEGSLIYDGFQFKIRLALPR